MEEDLFQAHKMEAIGTLAGGIAHDFNNILAVIIGFADMARDDIPEGNQAKKFMDQILKASNRAKDLVKQILTFSRKGAEIKQPIEPSHIIKEGIKLMRASLPTTIAIQKDIDPDCGLILANPTNIHQVLVNLCTNALHAMEDEKGVLTIKSTDVEMQATDIPVETGVSAGKFIELMVGDTGCGMDKATLERIFEPYFTTKEVGKGSGMGLALVHGIVQDCGGFIKVESKPGSGTEFHVYFPAIDEKLMAVEEEEEAPLPRGNERILVVDDEESILAVHQAYLHNLGYKVTTHCSSEKAFEDFQASPHSFDLVITDQTMPNLTGSELARKFLEIRPEIPVILCTGFSTVMSEEKAEKIGIKRFIMKPVSKENMATTVREVLDKQKS
jgi:CheY-like chemotaxis protein